MNEKKWWGYVHITGSIHLKHYSDEWGKLSMDEAGKSSFVDDIFGPFVAPNHEEAKKILKKELRP